MTGDQIQGGEVEAETRRAGKRHGAEATLVPSDFFDRLLDDVDEDADVAPALARAIERVRRAPGITRA